MEVTWLCWKIACYFCETEIVKISIWKKLQSHISRFPPIDSMWQPEYEIEYHCRWCDDLIKVVSWNHLHRPYALHARIIDQQIAFSHELNIYWMLQFHWLTTKKRIVSIKSQFAMKTFTKIGCSCSSPSNYILFFVPEVKCVYTFCSTVFLQLEARLKAAVLFWGYILWFCSAKGFLSKHIESNFKRCFLNFL